MNPLPLSPAGTHSIARLFLNAALALATLFVILFFLRIITAPTQASASSNTVFPASCLGGWQAAGLASGETTLTNSAQPGDYADTNSAVLMPTVAAQLFCGEFPVDSHTNPPHAAHVSFQWAFVTEETPITPTSTTTDESLTGTTVIGSPDSTSTVTLVIPALEPIDSGTRAILPGIEIIEQAPSESTQMPAPAPVDPPAATPLETPVPAPAPETPQSFIYKSTLGLITRTAHADPSPEGELVRVSYSIDGATWTYGGSATRDNWRTFSIRIPDPTWEGLKSLQVKIEPVTTTDTRPIIYLDSIALHIDDSPTIAETIGDKLAAAGDLLEGALDSVNDLADAAVDALTDATDPVPAEIAPAAQTATAAAPITAPTPLPKTRALTFSLAGNPIPSKEETPWQDKEIRDRLADSATNAAPPDVRVTDSGRGLLVSGACADVYATVLAFRKPEDYLKDPRAFIVNVAIPCFEGRFSYNLEDMPVGVQDGEYYLITGRQGATGSWIPVSAVLPFSIRAIEIDPAQD